MDGVVIGKTYVMDKARYSKLYENDMPETHWKILAVEISPDETRTARFRR